MTMNKIMLVSLLALGMSNAGIASQSSSDQVPADASQQQGQQPALTCLAVEGGYALSGKIPYTKDNPFEAKTITINITGKKAPFTEKNPLTTKVTGDKASPIPFDLFPPKSLLNIALASVAIGGGFLFRQGISTAGQEGSRLMKWGAFLFLAPLAVMGTVAALS